MTFRGRHKRNRWLKITVSIWHAIIPYYTIRRIRSELHATEALLAEANRKLKASSHSRAQNQHIKRAITTAKLRGQA